MEIARPARERGEENWVEGALNRPAPWALRGRIPYLLGLVMLFDSWDSTVIAYALPVIVPEWRLSALDAGWLVSAGYGGQFAGALLFGALAERFGRMPLLRLLLLAMSLLGIACALAADYHQLLVARLLQGLAIGGAMPIANCYVNEIAPTATRGRFFGTFQFIMLSGFGLAAMTSVWIVPNLGWRAMFLLGAMPLLVLPLLYLMPESPRWLVARGRVPQAIDALRRLGAGEAPIVAQETDAAAAPRASSPLDLLSPGVRRTSIAIGTMWFLTSLVGFGLVTWAPSIFVNNFGMPVQQALWFSSIGALAIFFTPLLLRQTIDRFGRRPPAIAATAIGATALLTMLLVPVSSWGLLVALLIVGHVGISIGTMVLWPYTAETFDTRLRAVALGTSSSLARAASMLTPLAVGGVIQLTGSVHPVFAVFGLSALAVAALWVFATRETAGRALGG